MSTLKHLTNELNCDLETLLTFLRDVKQREINPGVTVNKIFILQSPPGGYGKSRFYNALFENTGDVCETVMEGLYVDNMKCFHHTKLVVADFLDEWSDHRYNKFMKYAFTTHDNWGKRFPSVAKNYTICGTCTKLTERLVNDERLTIVQLQKKINIEWVKKNRDRIWGEVA